MPRPLRGRGSNSAWSIAACSILCPVTGTIDTSILILYSILPGLGHINYNLAYVIRQMDTTCVPSSSTFARLSIRCLTNHWWPKFILLILMNVSVDGLTTTLLTDVKWLLSMAQSPQKLQYSQVSQATGFRARISAVSHLRRWFTLCGSEPHLQG